MKVYLILDLSINDLEGFMDYIRRIPAFIKKHAGRYVIEGAEPIVMEGDWKPERIVLLEFPSRGNAEAFLADPEAQELFAIRHATTTSRLIMAEGCF